MEITKDTPRWTACDARQYVHNNYGRRNDAEPSDPDSQVWTIGPGEGPHWETDMGYDGYAMTKEMAELAVYAVNKLIDEAQ